VAVDVDTRARDTAPGANGVDFDAFCELFSGVPAAVTVVTARNRDGRPHGTTVSAFCSLSLNPPLVIVALDRSSDLLPLVERQGRFGINVLAGGQEEVGAACACKGPDKLAGTSWLYDAGLPRIQGSAAWLACEVQDVLDGGDHVIVVGLVTACEPGEAEPLVYHRRNFLRLPNGEGDPAIVAERRAVG
jgi:flavin reductase (DIM6/NTAB) family NADH-FMN oxidoreductase RutF